MPLLFLARKAVGGVRKAVRGVGRILKPVGKALGIGRGEKATMDLLPRHRADYKAQRLSQERDEVRRIKIQNEDLARQLYQRNIREEAEARRLRKDMEARERKFEKEQRAQERRNEQQMAQFLQEMQRMRESEQRANREADEALRKANRRADDLERQILQANRQKDAELAARLKAEQERNQKQLKAIQEESQNAKKLMMEQMQQQKQQAEAFREAFEKERKEQREEALKLQKKTEEAKQKQEELAREKEEIKKETAAMQKKFKRELNAATEALRAEREFLTKDYPKPEWLKVPIPGQTENFLNLCVSGTAGSGKSSLLNLLFGFHRFDADVFLTGCMSDTTKVPKILPLPIPGLPEGAVFGIDIPGADTPYAPLDGNKEYVDPKTGEKKVLLPYVPRYGLRYMDFVIVLTDARFRVSETKIIHELTKHNVPFILVASKVDQAISSVRNGGDGLDMDSPVDVILEHYRGVVMESLREIKVESALKKNQKVCAGSMCLGVFFVQCLNMADPMRPFDCRSMFDYPKMMKCISESFTKVRSNGFQVETSLEEIEELLKEMNEEANKDFQKKYEQHRLEKNKRQMGEDEYDSRRTRGKRENVGSMDKKDFDFFAKFRRIN